MVEGIKPKKHILKRMSLKTRLLLSLIFVVWLIGTLGLISIRIFTQRIINTYYSKAAKELSDTVAVSLDTDNVYKLKNDVLNIYDAVDEPVLSDEWGSDDFNAYISLYNGIEETPEFISLRNELRKYQNINEVDCLYIGIVDPKYVTVVYLVDGAYEDACPPGCADPLYEINHGLLSDPSIGFPSYVSNTGYGWLITAGSPIYYNGEVIAYAMTDISMTEIKSEQTQFLVIITLVILFIGLITIFVGIKLINKRIVRPISLLSDTARRYCIESNDVYHHDFERLEIDSEDEIGQLLGAMQQMERDMNTNIESLISTRTELKETIVKAEEMTDAAMKDPLTRVGSKIAYEAAVNKLGLEMMDPSCKFGIVMIDLNFLKIINDTYGHECGNVAIKNLSDIVCEVFKHSPVYRIGGDEFVIIVKGRDYNNTDRLIKELREILSRHIPDAMPYEVVSAAIGYAIYEDSDEEYKDVFKRADDDMYKNKKRMHRRTLTDLVS